MFFLEAGLHHFLDGGFGETKALVHPKILGKHAGDR